MILVVGAAVLAAGLMIGLTGVGGVLVVPALTALGNVDLERAIAASLVGFLLAGTPAAVVHLRRNQVPFGRAAALGVAAGAGAVVGAFTLHQLPASAVRLFIAALATASGIYALVRAGRSATAARTEPGTAIVLPLALLVGYASAISGTGGPVLLVPILLLLGARAESAIALGLAIQIPVTALATAVNIGKGRLDVNLAALLAVLLVLGMLAGTRIAARLSPSASLRAVGTVLVFVGLAYGIA